MARPAITSFTFMFDCVPLPVCQMTSGNWSSSFPSITSAAAVSIASAFSAPSASRFTTAAARFTRASAWTISIGICSRVPKGKFSRLRSVCAPQYAVAGTAMEPSESVSVRVSVMTDLLRCTNNVPALRLNPPAMAGRHYFLRLKSTATTLEPSSTGTAVGPSFSAESCGSGPSSGPSCAWKRSSKFTAGSWNPVIAE